MEKWALVASLSHIRKWQLLAAAQDSCLFRYDTDSPVPRSPHRASYCSQASPPHTVCVCLNPVGVCFGHTGLRCAFCCSNYIITHSDCWVCVCLVFTSRSTFLEGRDCALYFFSVFLSRQHSTIHITFDKQVLNKYFKNN